jgi:UPF0755 protein
MAQDKKSKKRPLMISLLVIILLLIVIAGGVAYYYFYSPFSTREDTQYVYIDEGDDINKVYAMLDTIGSEHTMKGLKMLAEWNEYPQHVKVGRYAIKPNASTKEVLRNLKNAEQEPLNVTVPSARTMGSLAKTVASKLQFDSLALYKALTDPATCQKLGFDTVSIYCLFIPETYNMYWTVSVDGFLERMKKEHDNFWNEERLEKARKLGLSPNEVVTLASIVAEESNYAPEKPTIAGLYLNRLRKGILLQSDPTVKFAMQDFALRRIYNRMLTIDNPYNTYKYAGLPPGPIRVPNVVDIDAVLNYKQHNYIYMCAKEDFSGSHNFAVTEAEHNANANRYRAALNARGIR